MNNLVLMLTSLNFLKILKNLCKILKKLNIKKGSFAVPILIGNIVQIKIYAISRSRRGFSKRKKNTL